MSTTHLSDREVRRILRTCKQFVALGEEWTATSRETRNLMLTFEALVTKLPIEQQASVMRAILPQMRKAIALSKRYRQIVLDMGECLPR